MFVQSEEFVKAHGGRVDDISIYGQESNYTTWRLAAMNLAIRGFAADLGKEPADTFARDQFPDLKFDYIMANPPFNISDWGGEKYEKTLVGSSVDPQWVMRTTHGCNTCCGNCVPAVRQELSSCKWFDEFQHKNGEGQIREAMVRGT